MCVGQGRMRDRASGHSVVNYNVCGSFQDKENTFLGEAHMAQKMQSEKIN